MEFQLGDGIFPLLGGPTALSKPFFHGLLVKRSLNKRTEAVTDLLGNIVMGKTTPPISELITAA